MNPPTRMPGRRLAVALAGLALLALAGCGGTDRPYPVSGKLVYKDNGEPVKELAGFEVTFTSEKLGKSAVGRVAEDGTFRLTTVRENDGAWPGKYRVILNQPHPEPERGERRHPVVDLAYENPEKSDLEATVEPQDNTFTFQLRRLKKSGK